MTAAGQARAALLGSVPSLSVAQSELVLALVDRLAAIANVAAVVLGGSHARGRARPDSDIDLGLLYREAKPFSIDAVRALARQVNDDPDPVVVGFHEWGPWVNGGSWLSIGGQRVDFLYRSIEHIERTVADARRGDYGHAYGQQPPFGFHSDTYLADVESCVALFDPERAVLALKRSVAEYPAALREKLTRHGLQSAKFGLYAARSAAAAGDAYLTAACTTRALNYLVQALYALNRRYRVNDKTALAELASAEHLPTDFGPRARALFAHLGAESEPLRAAVNALTQLAQEVVTLGQRALAQDGGCPAWLAELDMSRF